MKSQLRGPKLPAHQKKDEASSEVEDSGEESDIEEYAEDGWDELDDNEDFGKRMAKMAMKDDLKDFDLIPTKLHGPKKEGKR